MDHSEYLKTYSVETRSRIQKPTYRGIFTEEESAEKGLSLLKVGNGEAKIYWLVKNRTQKIKEVRFLSFGKVTSVAITDAFCELSRNKTIEEATSMSSSSIEVLLSLEKPGHLSGQKGDYAFIEDLQSRIKVAALSLTEVKPEKASQAYRRKELQEMNDSDRAWLPLSAPNKVKKIEEAIKSCMVKRTQYHPKEVELYNIKKDLQVMVRMSKKIQEEHRLMIFQFLDEGLKEKIHPEIVVIDAEVS